MSNNHPILITGATGWLGQRLVKVLANRNALNTLTVREIRCLCLPGDITPNDYRDQNVRYFVGNITDPTSLTPFFKDAECATLYHCAGIIHARPKVLHQINAEGTRNMLNAALKAGVRRFVHVSSNSPCGNNPDNNHLFTEDSPINPYMEYGRSKARAEWIVNQVVPEHMETVILRPTWFYGPGQPARQTQFFKMVKEGKAPIVGDGRNKRSMTYVDNMVHALLLAGDHPKAAGETFWVSDERPYEMREIVDAVEDALYDYGIWCKNKRLRLPAFTSTIAEVIDGAMQAVGLYDQRVHVMGEMGKTIACDISKAKNVLGYCPKVELAEGVRRSVFDLISRGIKI